MKRRNQVIISLCIHSMIPLKLEKKLEKDRGVLSSMYASKLFVVRRQ